MATFTGYLINSPDIFLAYGNAGLGTLTEPDYLLGADVSSNALYGNEVNTQPVSEPANVQTGIDVPMFGFLDWYNRIHFQYQIIDLGAVTADQIVTFRVFNAFFVNRTLNDRTLVGDSGLNLVDPLTPPYDFNPLEEKTYTLEVDEAGPFTINATITFEFDIGDFTIPVIGVRVVVWRWSPNWEPGMRERLEWVTDVFTAFDASEQRRQLRLSPKQFWEFTFDIEGKELRIFENVLYDWGARVWAVPIWPDIEVFKTTLALGSSIIPCTPATRAYAIGDLITIVAHDDSASESLEIETINVDSVEVTVPTAREWGPGTKVYPTRLAHLENGPQLTRFLRTYGYGVAQFRSDFGVDYDVLTGETTYRGYPVLEDIPELDPTLAYERKVSVVDYRVGLTFTEDEAELPWQVFGNRWSLTSREEIDHFRKWLYARAGRAKSFWVPTFADNLILAVPITAGSVIMDLEFAGLVNFSKANVHRRDIRIELNSGAVYYRRISGPATVDPDVERVTLNAVLGIDVDPDDVKMISWMSLCRLDSDTAEIVWGSPYTAESQTIFRGYRSDV